MKITLPGPFSQYRSFISETLPGLVYQVNMDSRVGGRFLRTTLKTDRLQNWKVIEDSPTEFEASVFLGKSSNRMLMGNRRILITAREDSQATHVELTSANRALPFILIGLLFCLLPGIYFFVVKVMNDGFERRVMGKVGAEVKTQYPEATVAE